MWQNGCFWPFWRCRWRNLPCSSRWPRQSALPWPWGWCWWARWPVAWCFRHAGGNHIARVRVALDQGSFTSLQADSTGAVTLLAGILLLIPGFITDLLGLLLLIVPLRRALFGRFQGGGAPRRTDGVVDLEPEQWQRVPDPALPDRRGDERKP